jgi:hypothetical protein
MENAIAKVESREKILGISLVDKVVAPVIEALPRSL